MNEAMLHLLGIALRAGRLSLGSDAAAAAMRGGGVRLLLLAADLSPRTAAAARAVAGEEKIRTTGLKMTMDEIGAALGKRTGVVAVNDPGFAEKLLALGADE